MLLKILFSRDFKTKKMKKFTLLIIIIFNSCLVFSQNFSKDWLNCIIHIEKEENGNLVSHGTGFSLYNYDNPKNDYVVTCAHVLKNRFIYFRLPATDSAIAILSRNKIDVINHNNRVWFFDGYSFRTKIELIKDVTFIVNDSLDIGIIKNITDEPVIIKGKDTIKLTKYTTIAKSRINKKNEVELGTNVYFLGFPFSIGSNEGYYGSGMYSDKRVNPLLRAGIIAWKGDESNEFLVDGLSYGGNSGSPIFTQSDFMSPRGPALIGMVLGHLGLTNKESLESNYGLARCIWIDDIIKLTSKFTK